MAKKNKCIKCSVESCKHNEDCHCKLDEIQVDCTCDGCKCSDKDSTICNNFKEKRIDLFILFLLF